jgi:hypothetical protein
MRGFVVRIIGAEILIRPQRNLNFLVFFLPIWADLMQVQCLQDLDNIHIDLLYNNDSLH